MAARFKATAFLAASTWLHGAEAACADPVAAIKHTIECVVNKDAACATSGYNFEAFEKVHNSRGAGSPLPFTRSFWQQAVQYSTFTVWFDHEMNVDTNMAEVRYREIIQMSDGTDFGRKPSNVYPFNATIKQYEHALVTVDDACLITKWDQYGDNAEQTAYDDAMHAMMAETRSASLVDSGACANPLEEIIRIMTCITNKDSACANTGYNWLRFNKYHNGQNTGVQIWPIDIYWSMAMKFSTFTLDYDYTKNIGRNKASVRYVETVQMSDGTEFEMTPRNEYPFNQTIIQYEHALVTVDDSCKMTRWDQYGDNLEQSEVDDAMDAFFANQEVKCHLNMEPQFWKCWD